MAILNKKTNKAYQPAEGYQSWKNVLRLLSLEAESLRFTKDGKLKELCLNTIWYAIEQHQRFTSFLRKLMHNMKTKSKYKPRLPKWFTMEPSIIHPKIHYIK